MDRSELVAAVERVLVPEQVTIALAEIVESAQEGLLALAVGAGLQVSALRSETGFLATGRSVVHSSSLLVGPEW